MPRAKRILYDGAVYHIIQRGHNKDELFKSLNDYKAFKDLIRRYKNKYSFGIYHYCIMSNHFHILIRPKVGILLPKIIQGITQSYALYYKRVYNHVGFLYQNRYKSYHIDNDAYLLECGRYIERNPMRANIVGHPLMYYWSSYNFYAKGKRDDIITTNPLYETFGSTAAERQKAYKEYIDQTRPYEAIVDKAVLS